MRFRRLRLLVGFFVLIGLIVWVWRDWHQHAPPAPTLQAGKHGNRHQAGH